jgi:DNA-binding beta-propeller fold protein YncE
LGRKIWEGLKRFLPNDSPQTLSVLKDRYVDRPLSARSSLAAFPPRPLGAYAAIGTPPALARPVQTIVDADEVERVGMLNQRPMIVRCIAVLFILLAITADHGLACTLDRDDILVTDLERHAVIEIDHQTRQGCVVSAGGLLVLPVGVAVDASGQVLVVDSDALDGNGAIVRIDPVNGAQNAIAQDGYFVDPHAIAIGKNGTIFVADPNAFGGNGGVIAVDPLTGRQTVISSAGRFVQPVGIALAPDGRLLVVDREALEVISVNRATGVQRRISSGDSFANPIGIAVGGGGKVFVAGANAFDQYAGAIVQVGPYSPRQRILSSGGSFISPVGVAIARSGELVVVDYDALIVVNPMSGSQTPMPWDGESVRPWGISIVR